MKFIKRFIGDGCGFLDPPAEIFEEESKIKFDEFKSVINNNKGNWEFTELSNSDVFDLTPIMPDGKIKTRLFEKPLALHLCVPPHSMHPAPPGILVSHVFVSILKMFRLNLDDDNTVSDVCILFLSPFYKVRAQRGTFQASLSKGNSEC